MSGGVFAGAAVRLSAVGWDGLAELARVLEDAGLPGDDVRLPGRRLFRVAAEAEGVCYGGLEGDGPDLLLRSAVVPPPARGRGLGRAIVAALEAEASRLGAARFFEGLGYRAAGRAAAPPALAATAQFVSLCPASAAYLVKSLPRR